VFKNAKTIFDENKSIRLIRLKSRRRLWLSVHLWLGLVLGLFLTIFGITGSILVFHAEIDEQLNPALLRVEPPVGNPKYKPLTDTFQAGILSMPKQDSFTFANYPRNYEAAFKLSFSELLATDQTQNRQVYVNPHTAKVIGKRLMSASDGLFPKTFVDFIFELHYALLLDKNPGYIIVSIMSALMIISLLTGLIVWWPLTGKWLQALLIKRKASTERLVFDLHKTVGFYSTLVLLPVLFSGIYMNVPEHVVPVLVLFSPVTYRYWFHSAPIPNVKPITMAQAVAIADLHYPTGRPDWIYGATSPDSTYTVCKHGVEKSGSILHRRCLVMDRYSGKILDIDDPTIGTAGEVFTQWQWPLHSGQNVQNEDNECYAGS
jgi:uncharacterized iron-regulated membrane protein